MPTPDRQPERERPPHAAGRVPVVTLATLDPVLRDATAAGLLCDVPGAVAVRHDLDVADGSLRRVVTDIGGVVEDERRALDHVCLGCALREDVVPTVRRLAAAGRWTTIVLALPVAAETRVVLRALWSAATDGAGFVVAGSAALFDPSTLLHDLFGDDLLADRSQALSPLDRRAVGEVLARQLEHADVLLTPRRLRGRVGAVVDHLVGPVAARHQLHDHDTAAALLRPGQRDLLHAADPGRVAPTGSPDRLGVWTLDLKSWRPLHPRRLLDRLDDLGAGPLRARGHFWLPTRPTTVGVWDGAGGQLSIGTGDGWQGHARATRIVVTGLDGHRDRVAEAFDDVVLTDAELARGLGRWTGRADGLDRWLGRQQDVA